MIKRKHLESFLQNVSPFESPKRSLEQYLTQPSNATDIILKIHENNALESKNVADLGSGTGMYSFGSYYCGASKVFSQEIDQNARDVMQESQNEAEIEENRIQLVDWDVFDETESELETILAGNLFLKIDTVITNPPFGCSKNEGIDAEFIMYADKVLKGKGKIFSIHKTSTREYLEKFCEEGLDRDFEVLMEFDFEIPFTEFDKEDMKKWTKANEDPKKKSKTKHGNKQKMQVHKKELDYCKCDLIMWSARQKTKIVETKIDLNDNLENS